MTSPHKSTAHATALHEASHAVAYISQRLKFAYVSVDEAFTAPDGERMDDWQRAVTCMAGPACEGVMYHWETGTDADVLDYIVSGRAETLEHEDEEPSDHSQAGPLAMAALPLALALVTANWPVIEQIAQAAMESPAALAYEKVMSIAADRVRLDPTEYQRWDSLCATQST